MYNSIKIFVQSNNLYWSSNKFLIWKIMNQQLTLELKKDHLDQLEEKSKELSRQLEEMNLKMSNLNQQRQQFLGRIQNLKKEIDAEETKRKQLTQQLENQQQTLDSKKSELKVQFDEAQIERNEFQTQLGMEVQRINQLTQEYRESVKSTTSDSTKQIQSRLDQLYEQNRKLKDELELQQESQQTNQNKEHQIQRLQEIVESKERYKRQVDQESKLIQDDIDQYESQIQMRDQNINQLSFELKQEEKKLKTLIQQVDSMKEQIKLNDDRIRLKSQQISQLEEKALSVFKNSGNRQQLNALKQDVEHQDLMYDQELRKKQGEITQSKIALGNNKKQQKELEENQRQLKIKQGKELQMKFKESFGQLEVCFLIDSTASMEPYKRQAQLCVKGSVKAIKVLTQRDTSWSTVCYVDTDILPKLGGMYQQYGFTRDSNELERFIEQVKCTPNRDLPEDVEGGMKQMLNNIPWQTKFKLAILICDCPCHGTKFHNYRKNEDFQPDADFTPTIERMIQEEIFFIGIIFTKHTIKMYEEITKIYQRHGKEEYFILSDLSNISQDLQYEKLTEVLSFASAQATQTNVKTTRTLNQANAILKNEESKNSPASPVEALCKVDLKQGLNADNAVRETFKVFRLQMKEESFQEKMKAIQNIGVNDFSLIEENDWDCLRSKNAFAKGAMKAAFLMIKSKNMGSKNEFYVCKTPLNMQPYPNQESAIKECILHLVSQKWLRKYYKDLDEVAASTKQQYPQISYSDILLLQDANKKFWLAERFFEGNFIKYNNNWGFVNSSTDDINKLAQCFSYYTYFKSDYQYLICDIQGVGTCLTDPAICTKNNHKIDPTDMGEEGIGRYVVSFGAVKNSCTNILKALKIEL
ncbi:unnamed protein product (macronuclear) [Paramecium tetraurelia]|uniref:Alpha-type protein kinase domain-containing protein n=1 Tax=Paramecium tetraurelia TaxID=5888 RepID=A0DZA3_PARTE|nr:uncharacterized protein GSPATT00003339001 [Paramecium tetraurelia]CAK88370.1 unnamed protein product [Paramecium tetraurelia]|eukprot:XP_001455767.1 hypothetical protein (macronuclear) [Paramecium tetraurelia strain d4-2]